eukprot:scaffold10395_cov133-Isochrysis_galbana.AAC.2
MYPLAPRGTAKIELALPNDPAGGAGFIQARARKVVGGRYVLVVRDVGIRNHCGVGLLSTLI